MVDLDGYLLGVQADGQTASCREGIEGVFARRVDFG